MALTMVEKMFNQPDASFEELLPKRYTMNVNAEMKVAEDAKLLKKQFVPNRKRTNANDKFNYVMGMLRAKYEGRISMDKLAKAAK